MALTDIQPVTKPGKKGGGLFGSLLGGGLGALIGGALAVPTGGASLGATAAALGAGAASGAGAGMTGGQILGELVKPTEGSKTSQVIQKSESKPTPLTVMAENPEVQLASITEAQKLLPQSNLSIDMRKQYRETLEAGKQKLLEGLQLG